MVNKDYLSTGAVSRITCVASCHAQGMPLDYIDIGERLQRARKAAGRTQKDVARDLGVTPQNISLVEKGQVKWPVDKLEQYAEAIGARVLFSIADPDDPASTVLARLGGIIHELDPGTFSTLRALVDLWEAQHAAGALDAASSTRSS